MELNNLDLNKLHVFWTVARTGSMAEAAKALLRTPSAISQSITALEESLGLTLFQRIGRRLFLSESGKSLYHGLDRYQADLARLVGDLTDQRQVLAGAARLGLPPGFSTTRMGPVGAEFLRRFDEAQLRLRFLNQPELAEALAASQLDLALSFMPLERLNRNLVSEKVYDEELILVSSPALKRRARFDRDDLESLPVIEYYQAPSLYRQWVKHHFGFAPRRPHIRAFASTLDYVLDLALRGVGFAVVPMQALAARGLEKELTLHRPGRARPLAGQVWLNRAKAVRLAPVAEQLRLLLRERLNSPVDR